MSDTPQDITSAKPTDIPFDKESYYPTAYRCAECPFKGKIIGSKGPVDSPFVIIGESPGVRELKEGIPFVGPSGVVLKAALDQHIEGSYPPPYISNAFKCFPGKEKNPRELHKPTMACHKQLMDELQLYPRKVILALGNPAVWSTTNNYDLRITKARGRRFQSDLASQGIIASVHPAFLLRGGGNFRQFKADVDYAIRLLLGGVPKGVPNTTYTLIDSQAALDGFISDYLMSPSPYIAADYETTGFSHLNNRLICAGYSLNGRHSYIVPILDNPETLAFLNVIHSLPGARFIWHNGKFDIKFAHAAGIPEAFVHEDTMLMSYALDETRGIHDLETVGSDWLGSPNWKNELKKFIPKKGNYSHAPRPKLYLYLSKDLYNTWAVFFIFRDILAADPVSSKLYNETLIPASKMLARVEERGIYVDRVRVKENDKAFTKEEKHWSDELNRIAIASGWHEINPNSPPQLCEFLFDHLKLKSRERATHEKILRDLPDHPAVMVLRKHRKVQKSLSTYVTSIYDNIDIDGRVHSTFLLHGTATGRLSSRNPNVENIPRDYQIRGQYIAAPGRILIEPDLNQAELRSLAVFSGDPELIRIYTTQGMSLHEEVRHAIFGAPKDWSGKQITDFMFRFNLKERIGPNGDDLIIEEQKMRAKTVNFGIVYGREAPSIAEEYHISVPEAQGWITTWFKRFKGAAIFINNCRMAPVRMQNLKTVFGHRKRFGVVTLETLKTIQNQAANFPHQSFASTVCLHAAMRTQDFLAEEHDAHFINLIHDSLLIDCPDNDDAIRIVTNYVMAEMEQVPRDYGIRKVPFIADAKIGYRWGSAMKQKEFWRTRKIAQNLDS